MIESLLCRPYLSGAHERTPRSYALSNRASPFGSHIGESLARSVDACLVSVFFSLVRVCLFVSVCVSAVFWFIGKGVSLCNCEIVCTPSPLSMLPWLRGEHYCTRASAPKEAALCLASEFCCFVMTHNVEDSYRLPHFFRVIIRKQRLLIYWLSIFSF